MPAAVWEAPAAAPSGDSGDAATDGEPGMYECTLGPGDIMYVPESWYHATLNAASPTVAMAWKNCDPAYEAAAAAGEDTGYSMRGTALHVPRDDASMRLQSQLQFMKHCWSGNGNAFGVPHAALTSYPAAAIRGLEAAVLQFPHEPDFHFQLGSALLAAHAHAHTHTKQRSVDVQPNGSVHAGEQELVDKATQQLQLAVAANPLCADCCAMFSRALEARGDTAGALNATLTAWHLAPSLLGECSRAAALMLRAGAGSDAALQQLAACAHRGADMVAAVARHGGTASPEYRSMLAAELGRIARAAAALVQPPKPQSGDFRDAYAAAVAAYKHSRT
jgi:hypothetical protein